MNLLTKLARFSKFVSKYQYYPTLVGAIALCSFIVYRGEAQGAFAAFILAVCVVLLIFVLLKNKLCKMAGEDPKIR